MMLLLSTSKQAQLCERTGFPKHHCLKFESGCVCVFEEYCGSLWNVCTGGQCLCSMFGMVISAILGVSPHVIGSYMTI